MAVRISLPTTPHDVQRIIYRLLTAAFSLFFYPKERFVCAVSIQNYNQYHLVALTKRHE